LGNKFGDSEMVNPKTHIKKFNDIKNLNDKQNQMANPASIYCVERKGNLESGHLQTEVRLGIVSLTTEKNAKSGLFSEKNAIGNLNFRRSHLD